jgi:hypothetical protein
VDENLANGSEGSKLVDDPSGGGMIRADFAASIETWRDEIEAPSAVVFGGEADISCVEKSA